MAPFFPLASLPDDVLLVVLSFMSPFELFKIEQINKRFKNLVKSAFLQIVSLKQAIPHRAMIREQGEREKILSLLLRCGPKLRFVDIGPRVNYAFHIDDGAERFAKKCPNGEMFRMIGPQSLGAYAKALDKMGLVCKVKVLYTSPVITEFLPYFKRVEKIRTVYLEGLADYVKNTNNGLKSFGTDIFSMSTPWERVKDVIDIIKFSYRLEELELKWWFGDSDVVPSTGLMQITSDFSRPSTLDVFKFTCPQRMMSSIHPRFERAVTHLDVNAYAATVDEGFAMERFENIRSIFLQEEELFKAAAKVDFPRLTHLSVARSNKHDIVPWGVVSFLKHKGKQLRSIKLDYSLVTAPSILTIADFIVLYCTELQTIELDMHYVKFAMDKKAPQMEVNVLSKIANMPSLRSIEIKLLRENDRVNNELMNSIKTMQPKLTCLFFFTIT